MPVLRSWQVESGYRMRPMQDENKARRRRYLSTRHSVPRVTWPEAILARYLPDYGQPAKHPAQCDERYRGEYVIRLWQGPSVACTRSDNVGRNGAHWGWGSSELRNLVHPGQKSVHSRS